MSSYIQFYFHLYSLAYSRKTYNLLYRKSQQLECLYQTILLAFFSKCDLNIKDFQ